MAEPWIKLDTSITSNPKVMRLPGDMFKFWICVLCEAKRFNEGGLLPPLPRLAFSLHMSDQTLKTFIERLYQAGLVDLSDDDVFSVHDWEDWQRPKPSESKEAVAERVRRWREARVTPRNTVTGVTAVTAVTPEPNGSNAPRLEEKREEKKRQEQTRGIRIPADLTMNDDMLAYAREHGINERAARDHFAEYHLYWQQATKNATSRDWRARWKSSLARDIREERIRPDLSLAHAAEDDAEPQATPAETAYREMVGAIMGKVPEVSEITERVVVQTLGGWEAVRANLPGYPQWLTAWHSTGVTDDA